MTVRIFVIGSFLTAVLSWAIWAAIVSFLDPLKAGMLGYVLFFLVLFLALASTGALAGYGVRRLVMPEQLSAYTVRVALRQGLLISLFFNVLLLLHLIKLYRWWIAVITIALFLVSELVFLSFDRTVNQRFKKTYDKVG